MDSGTPRISDQSCGTFLIRESINPKVFAFFRFQIGPSLMCGSTSMSKKFRLCRCITREREVVERDGSIVVIYSPDQLLPGERTKFVRCRMRSLGCMPCTGAIRSEADTVPKIIEEMISFRRSERENRAIDHDEEGSMEIKKREGYF